LTFIEQRSRAKQWLLQWKGAQKRNSQKPTQMVLFIKLNELTCHGPAFERTGYLWSNVHHTVNRR
jgi:hypothetical protein